MLNGWGDQRGYHLDIGRGASGFVWHEAALIRPAGLDVESWTGYQCLSGDGRYAAVALEPTSVVTIEAARDRGAFAYSVDLASGEVRPIAAGVGLRYFSPGCGTGDDAVFTLNLGQNDELTELVKADLSSGKVTQTVRVAGQVTSTIPTSSGLVGAVGSSLVSIGSNGRTRRVATVGGDPYDLRAAQDGGVSFLSVVPGELTAHAQHEHGGSLSTLATGSLARLGLFQGRGGVDILTGASKLQAGKTRNQVKVENGTVLPNGASAASLDGGALIGDPTGKKTTPLLLATRGQHLATDKRAVSTARPVEAGSSYEPPGAAAANPSMPSVGMLHPHGDAAQSTSTPSRKPQATSKPGARPSIAPPTDPNQSPTCAVPPLDETKQVLQPSPAQATWASQMDEQGLLTGSTYARPANFDNLGLASYSPSSDFPPIALQHPSGSTTNSVPSSVYEAIMAQESNYDQASFHAPEGTAGDPLIADYYGADYDIVSIDYSSADCGYGIGQVTDGMHVGDTSLSAHGQIKVAVDYQENIAAGLQILETTWNQLYTDGIIANNGDPRDLENWFYAAWAYNSGIQPTGQYDQGCTPGPTCTGTDGTWGMGWANNPENPDYPPNRDPYLKDTYADAAHPADWSYEERIMGWMASPILKDNTQAYQTPTYHGSNSWLQIPPFATFCSLSGNHCDPTKTNTSQTDAGHCMLNDYECWWHQPATWISTCATTCATSAYQYSGGSEPVDTNSNPFACNVDHSTVPSSAIIVDDETSPYYNVMGCSGENWTSNGTFTYAFGKNAAGDPIGAIDTHQLGTGLGGHDIFTHTEDGTNPALINTGTWTPNLPSLQYYKIKIHFPALGANATDVIYTINPGGGVTPFKFRVNQAWNADTWVTLGTFAMQNGANVVLTNKSTVVGSGNESLVDFDVAFDALAFIPEGGTPGQPIGGPPTVQDAPRGSNPAWVQCLCAHRTAGDPVDTATGYYGDTWTDLSTPGRGMPLDFTRTYTESTADPAGPNKASAANGPFGYGWTDSYNFAATTNSTTGAVSITQEDGSQVAFSDASGVYTPTEPRDDATLAKSGTTYIYTRRGRDIFTFDTATGHLTAEQDLAGKNASTPYKTSLAYNSSNQLSTITDPDGRLYTLTWTSGHITKLVDSAGRTVTYSYDASNDLTGVYGVGTTRSPSLLTDDLTTYAYNTTTHLMTSIRSPRNQGAASAVTAMTYDSSERVLTQTDPDGDKTTFTYGPSSSPSLVAGQTLVTDPAGHRALYTYANGLLTSETVGYGTSAAATTSYTYDPVSLGVNTSVDPKGDTTTYSYDDHGNKTSSSDPLGYTTDYAYDNAGDLIEAIDPSGVATINAYDQAGHIKTASGTNSGTFTYGDLTSTTVTEANNIVDSRTGNFGTAPTRTLNFYYDDAAHPADVTRSVDPRGKTTTQTYDAAGDLASSTDADGNKTLQGWDTTRGWQTSSVSANGVAAGTTTSCTPPATGCTTYAHDLYGDLVKTTDPLGHTTSNTFDAGGNTTSSTDADGNKTSYTFDPAGRLTITTRPDATTVTSTYNSDGTVATSTDPAGQKTSYTYDGQGRQVTTTNPDARVTTTGYDANGSVTTIKNAAGQTTTTNYNADQRPTAITYSDGVTPNDTNISYDADGRRTASTDGTGTSTWTYDAFGDVISSTTGSGATVQQSYDSDGNLSTLTYPDGKNVTNSYDNASRWTLTTDSAGNQTTFGYDPNGSVTSTTYPNGTKVADGYNTADQQTSTTLTKGTTTLGALTYGRDSAGQVTSQTPSGSLPGVATTFGYTALQQVKTATVGSTTSNYAYDNADNISTNVTATQKSDAADQLCWSTTSSVTGAPACTAPPAGATTYSYDDNGARTASTPASGTASSYAYNQANQLTTAITPTGTGSYTYDGTGLRATKTVGAVTTHFTYSSVGGNSKLLTDGTTDYIYGPTNQPIEQTSSGATSFFVCDQVGSTVALTNTAGAISGTYTYNTYGKVTAHAGTATTPLEYGSGYTDSETGLIYLQNRYYDPATGLFLTVDPDLAATGQPYAYVGDNPVNGSDPQGLCWPSWVCSAASSVSHFAQKHWVGVVKSVHAVAGVVATVAGGCAVIAGLSVVGNAGLSEFCAGVAFTAAGVQAASGGALYATGHESGRDFALDSLGAVAGGAGYGLARASSALGEVVESLEASGEAAGFLKSLGYAFASGVVQAGELSADILNNVISLPAVLGGGYLTVLELIADCSGE